MNAEKVTDFDQQYLATWTETDTQQRHAIIERLWAADGQLAVSSTGETVQGVAAITAHIDHVHEEMIVGHGLRFAYDQHIDSGDAVLLRWSMLTPDGGIAGRGVDVLHRNEDGRVQTVHMFMGVN